MRMQNTVYTTSWDEIVESYRKQVIHDYSREPMVEFSQEVATSRYSAGLYPCRSMATLLIGQTPNFEWMREVIHVEYLPKDNSFHFDFWESPVAVRHWSRECAPSEAFAVFERLLRAKRWFWM